MNDKDKKEIVSKLTDEHKKTLQQWAKDADREVKDLVSQFCEIYSMEEAEQGFGDKPERIDWAMRVIKARIAHESATPTEEFEIYVIGKQPPATRKNSEGNTFTVGSVMGLGVSESENKLKRIELTGWDDKASKINEIEHDKGYRINASKQNSTRDKLEYQIETSTTIEEIDFKPDNVTKLLRNFFETTEIAEAKQNTSKNRNDLKMIRGIIEDIQIITTKNGNKLGRLGIYDGSIPTKDVSNHGGLFTVMVPAEMAKFGADSEVCFIGTIRDDKEYGPSMFANAMVDIIGINYEPDLEDVSESSVEIEDASDVIVDDEEIHDEADFDSMI